jgi:hypothetical protein
VVENPLLSKIPDRMFMRTPHNGKSPDGCHVMQMVPGSPACRDCLNQLVQQVTTESLLLLKQNNGKLPG